MVVLFLVFQVTSILFSIVAAPIYIPANSVQVKKVKVKVSQSCPTLCDPMDYSVQGILQARILEWVALSLLQGIFPTQRSNPGLPHCRQILYQLSHKTFLKVLLWVWAAFCRVAGMSAVMMAKVVFMENTLRHCSKFKSGRPEFSESHLILFFFAAVGV